MNNKLYIISSAGNEHLCYKQGDTFVDISNECIYFIEGEDELKIIPVKCPSRDKIFFYKEKEVKLIPSLYFNGWISLSLVLADTEEPYTTLTVNLEQTSAFGLPDNIFVDINNNPEALKFLVNNGLAKYSGYNRESGWIEYPMAILDFPELYRICPDFFEDTINIHNGKANPNPMKIDFRARVEELRNDIIDAIRQLLYTHKIQELSFPEEQDNDPSWIIWFDKNSDPHECRVTGVEVTDNSIAVLASEKDSGNEVACYSPFELGAKNIDWLHEIYETAWRILEQPEDNDA